jgi:pimeloyl-ACP methyl ester carboxylesterase
MRVQITEKQVDIGSLQWFYREVDPKSDFPPVILLHGLVSQSYGWCPILLALAQRGFRALAPDWIGSGFSAKPEVDQFNYRPEAFLQALGSWLDYLQLTRFSLVVQGFLGSVGLQYALRHPEQIERLVILNTPLSVSAQLPWSLKLMGFPLIGDMLTQDPLLVDRTLESGGIYRVSDLDLTIFRRPFLTSSEAGRALLATIRNLSLSDVGREIEAGLPHWNHPTLLLWGVKDPWLSWEMAETVTQGMRKVKRIQLEEVGHYPQHDWHEKVSEAMLPFLSTLVI